MRYYILGRIIRLRVRSKFDGRTIAGLLVGLKQDY